MIGIYVSLLVLAIVEIYHWYYETKQDDRIKHLELQISIPKTEE